MSKRLRIVLALGQALFVATAAGLVFSSPAEPAAGNVADLHVSIADSPDPVVVGNDLTYAIQVTDLGPSDATGVVVTDRLPSHADYVGANPGAGSCVHQGGRVTCQIGPLAATAGSNLVTVTIVVRPTRPGTISSSASVDAVESDPNTADDNAEASTVVEAPPRESSCRGIRATVVGTPGADRLVGTPGPDVIAGLGGSDVILGLSGRDLICSGGGNDRVYGGTAADRIFGGRGADRLLGRGGPDLLAGNPGRDVLKGNAGADRLRGGRGSDRCVGGAGRDVLRSCER